MSNFISRFKIDSFNKKKTILKPKIIQFTLKTLYNIH